MQNIAFVRNVNQGQRGHPSAQELIDAFVGAGASEIFTFRSNGTLVFNADLPEVVADRLRESSPLRGREVFLRAAEFVESMLRFEGVHNESRLEVTLFDEAIDISQLTGLASASARGRCEIVESGNGWALVLNHVESRSNGTPVVEFVTGAPATSRSLATMVALAERLSA